jgi:hypothetical protein
MDFVKTPAGISILAAGAVYGGLTMLQPDFMYTPGGMLRDPMYTPLNAALVAAAVVLAYQVGYEGKTLMGKSAAEMGSMGAQIMATAKAGVSGQDTFYE